MGRRIRVDDVIQTARDDTTISTTQETNETATTESAEPQQTTEPEELPASETDAEDQRQKGRGASSFGRRYRAVQFAVKLSHLIYQIFSSVNATQHKKVNWSLMRRQSRTQRALRTAERPKSKLGGNME